jgi:hypothetical protein
MVNHWNVSLGSVMRQEGGEGHSLGELHPGDETTVMAYLVVVGGGECGSRVFE